MREDGLMTGLERDVRAAVYAGLPASGEAPTAEALAAALGIRQDDVVAASGTISATPEPTSRPSGRKASCTRG